MENPFKRAFANKWIALAGRLRIAPVEVDLI